MKAEGVQHQPVHKPAQTGVPIPSRGGVDVNKGHTEGVEGNGT